MEGTMVLEEFIEFAKMGWISTCIIGDSHEKGNPAENISDHYLLMEIVMSCSVLTSSTISPL